MSHHIRAGDWWCGVFSLSSERARCLTATAAAAAAGAVYVQTSDKDQSPQCDYEGLTCLDKMDLVFPQTTIMQPWQTNGLVCDCLPSCTEHEIRLIGRTYM